MGYNFIVIEPPVCIENFVDEKGKSPFSKWLASLKDVQGRAIIRTRLNRIRLGNLGDCKSVGKGVLEIRVVHGPGYRIYFGKESKNKIILLLGGTKNSQKEDIKKAQSLWAEYCKESEP